MNKILRQLKNQFKNLVKGFVLAGCVWFLFPFACGILSYGTTYTGGVSEQEWLDEAVQYLCFLHHRATDPQVKEVLQYTIKRYRNIGPFDVSISRCNWVLCHSKNTYAIGINAPWCPGVTLDQEVLTYPVEIGALVLVHEALHDYYPYFGHSHVTPVMAKVEKLSLDSGTYGTIRFTKRVFN